MDKIYLLIGNDTPLAVCLRKSEGEETPVPYDLSEARHLRLTLVGHGMRVCAEDIEISGEDDNIVSGVIPGRSLLKGDYDLEVTFNLDGRDKRFAVKDMFEAVDFLAEDADGEAEGEGAGIFVTVTVQPELIEISGPTGPKGKSAYQVWLDDGHTGTEDDFFEWLAAQTPNPDWEQNDPSKADYIKGRTHYEETSTIKIDNALLAWSGSTPETLDFWLYGTDVHIPRTSVGWGLTWEGGELLIDDMGTGYELGVFNGEEWEYNPFDPSYDQQPYPLNVDVVITSGTTVHKLPNKFLDMDSEPTTGSGKPVTSGGVKAAIADFVTRAVNDLLNYYTKTETYTKAEVNQLVAGINNWEIVPVAQLPEASADTMHKIYLVPSSNPKTRNVKDEFITVEVSGAYSWEQIGTTAIDLTNYVTKQDLTEALADYVTSTAFTQALALKQDVIADLPQIREGASNNVKYTSQSLTDAQKEQARANIGAASDSEVSQLRSDVDDINNLVYDREESFTMSAAGTHPYKFREGYLYTLYNDGANSANFSTRETSGGSTLDGVFTIPAGSSHSFIAGYDANYLRVNAATSVRIAMRQPLSVDITDVIYPGELINTAAGTVTYLPESSYPNQARTSYIAVTPGEKLLISGRLGSQIGFAGYGNNLAYLSRLCDTSSAPVYKVQYADNFLIVIPANVYYIQGCTMDNVNYPLKVRRVGTIQESINNVKDNRQIKIVPVSGNEFNVFVPQDNGVYFKHSFSLQNYSKTLNYPGGTKTVLCGDIWYAETSNYGNCKIQGNLNFIYQIADGLTSDSSSQFYNENGHVGSGHGGEIKEFQRFYADGKEFDPATLSTVIECSVMSIVCKAKDYAIDTTQPEHTSAQACLKLDANGDPILTAIHTYKVEYRANNHIKWENNLLIKRNGVKFQQCFGGMVQGSYPEFDNVTVTTKKYDSDDYNMTAGTFTPVGDSLDFSVSLNRYQTAGGVILSGDHCIIRQEMRQAGDRFDENYVYIQPYSDRLKVYQQPVKTQGQFDLATAEEFNDGDYISVRLERCIEYRK